MEGGDAKLVAEFGFVLSVLRSVGLSQAEAALVRELDAQFHGLGSQLTDLSPSDDGTPRSTSEPATDAHRSSDHQLSKVTEDLLHLVPGTRPESTSAAQHAAADAAIAAASLASIAPWGKEVEEYEAFDDVGYRRKRIADPSLFVEQELELLASEESSELYTTMSGKVAAQAASKQGTTATASVASSADASPQPSGASAATTEPQLAFPDPHPMSAGRDETWDMGPLDIKLAEPVMTPRKSTGARSTDEPKPVLSRVESLSSSFKDFDLERLDDGRCVSRGSQPSEYEAEDGIRFNPPAGTLDEQPQGAPLSLFASLQKGSMATAAAAAAAVARMAVAAEEGGIDTAPPLHKADTAGSFEAQSPPEREESERRTPDRADAKEQTGGFSFPVTPSHAAAVDPKPLPWPIRSASTSDRMLDSSSPMSTAEGASRSKLGRSTADDALSEPLSTSLFALGKAQQRTASDSGIIMPAGDLSLAARASQAVPSKGLAVAGLADDALKSGGSDASSSGAAPALALEILLSPTAGAAVSGVPEVSALNVAGLDAEGAGTSGQVELNAHRISVEEELESSPRERLQQARQGTARQPVGGVTSRPRPEGEQGLADEGEDDADSASLSGPYIQPEPVDWMEGEEEGMAEDLEGSADDEEEADAEQLPKYTLDENGAIVYQYDPSYIARKYEVFTLQVIHRRHRTGFEETKDFPIRMNDLIAGRYQVMDFLGSAAFSRAVQALDIKTNTLCCLKIVKNNKDYFDQSLDEIKLLKFVNSCDPHDEHGIVRLYDYFYYKEHLFLVCELLRANLYEFQKYNKESGEELYFTNARIQKIAVSVLKSLAFLHSLDLIHSDLKPENILIKSYSRCEVKVIDLGSSCFTTDQLSSYVQSRSYRAPEVILGLPYDHKVDIWSLGCILAELSSGFVLFQNDSVATLLARLEGILGRIPAWMVEKGRYANRFYTRSGQLYERSQAPQHAHHSPQHSTGGHSSSSHHSHHGSGVGATPECYEILVPKKTSLRARVPDADPGLLSFVSFLLNVDPTKRPSARDALCHPWLQHQYKSLDSMS